MRETQPTGTTFLVFSYLRFSDPGQEMGDSIRRQKAARDGWLNRHPGARLDRSLLLVDRGKSGYYEENLKGALGEFMRLVMAGDPRIPKGSVLLLENMDRLSRAKPVIASNLLTNILVAGIRVVALYPEEIELTLDSDIFALLRGQLPLARGHDESKIKVVRAKADAVEKKRLAREKRQPFTDNLPAWVRMVGEVRNANGKILVPGRLELIPALAATVRLIFDLALDGFGLTAIVRYLNDRKVRPFGAREAYTTDDGRVRHRKREGGRYGSGKWVRSTVANVLRDRRAVGEFQPYTLRGADGKRQKDGPPIAGFFPAVVTESEWLAMRAGAGARRTTRGRNGPHVNAFKGLLKNARDGEKYFCETRVDDGKRTKILKNLSAAECRAPMVSFPFDTFEKAMLSRLREVPSDVIEGPSDAAAELAALEAEWDGITAELADAAAYMARKGFSETIGDRVRALEVMKADLAPKLADARSRVECPARTAWATARNLMTALDAAPDKDAARRRLREALRRSVKTILLLVVPRGSVRLMAVQVFFVGGSVRDYLIKHRKGDRNGRPSAWEVDSVIHPDVGGAVDLRNPKAVKLHEAVMKELDVTRPLAEALPALGEALLVRQFGIKEGTARWAQLRATLAAGPNRPCHTCGSEPAEAAKPKRRRGKVGAS